MGCRRRPGTPRLGSSREVLRKSAAGLRSPVAATGMVRTGRTEEPRRKRKEMNCANHPDTAAVAYCRACGKPFCQVCQRQAQGTVYCQEHEPGARCGEPYTARRRHRRTRPLMRPTPHAPSPGLAFVLGLIPGVGAIYNGQYAKGVIHVILLGILISIVSSGSAHGFEPLFGMLDSALVLLHGI